MLLDESSHIGPSSRAADQEVKTDHLKHNSEEQFSSGEEVILPPRDTWQCLETFLIVTTWGMGAPTGRGQ